MAPQLIYLQHTYYIIFKAWCRASEAERFHPASLRKCISLCAHRSAAKTAPHMCFLSQAGLTLIKEVDSTEFSLSEFLKQFLSD